MSDSDGSGTHERSPEKGEVQKKQKKVISTKKLAKFKHEVDKKGIVYLSRVPPYMAPSKVKHHMSKYGEVGRIYLAPEDTAITAKRKRAGGNKKVKYVDGWIEFEDKNVAKMVAKSLNAQPIGGKNRSFYAHDLWNLKYLSKFKWNHLTEKISYDNAVRRQRLMQEVSQAKREKEFFLDKVQEAKKFKGIEQKNAKKALRAEGAVGVGDDGADVPQRVQGPMSGIRRTFQQRSTTGSDDMKKESIGSSLMSKIFAGAGADAGSGPVGSSKKKRKQSDS